MFKQEILSSFNCRQSLALVILSTVLTIPYVDCGSQDRIAASSDLADQSQLESRRTTPFSRQDNALQSLTTVLSPAAEQQYNMQSGKVIGLQGSRHGEITAKVLGGSIAPGNVLSALRVGNPAPLANV